MGARLREHSVEMLRCSAFQPRVGAICTPFSEPGVIVHETLCNEIGKLHRTAHLPDILALRQLSKIFGHCDDPALPFHPVCGCGISSCSVLKYWLENEELEVAMSEKSTDVL